MPQNTPLTLSVVIPAFNEEQNISTSLRSLWTRLEAAGIDYELVVVNDNSTDQTSEVLTGLAAENPRIKRVDRFPPRGFGRAIRTGLDAAKGDVLIIYMADASDEPDDVVMYFKEISNGYDCVFGSRFIKGSRTSNYPKIKLMVNRLVNTMLRLLFWTRFNDLTNSFKAYRSHVIRECGPYRASHFNITIELSLSALIRNYNILQVPISWQGRTWGSSNLHLTEMGRRYLSTLIKIFFEKTLIRDDLIAETVSQRSKSSRDADLESRVLNLEARLEALERDRR
ncbi:MAG: glycosyltransferase family 2 protein [Desulfovibrio sp.]|nr:glycosyltransferase family 2 protein [Desulfovibrio sp.]MBI4959997.1 glycosyltransferase family 2 protein [Desulfovibrio sp.]